MLFVWPSGNLVKLRLAVPASLLQPSLLAFLRVESVKAGLSTSNQIPELVYLHVLFLKCFVSLLHPNPVQMSAVMSENPSEIFSRETVLIFVTRVTFHFKEWVGGSSIF